MEMDSDDNQREGDDEDDDLYGDLESNIFHRPILHQNDTQVPLTDTSNQLERLLASAYEENQRLKLKLKELKKTNAIILKNASSLQQTAKLQLSQKDQVVKSLQKKLQELRKNDPTSNGRKDWTEVDKLISACLSSIPSYSLEELSQTALNGIIQNGHDRKGETRTNNWTKKFRHENVSYYFYSHHEDTVRTEPTTKIVFSDPVFPRETQLGSGLEAEFQSRDDEVRGSNASETFFQSPPMPPTVASVISPIVISPTTKTTNIQTNVHLKQHDPSQATNVHLKQHDPSQTTNARNVRLQQCDPSYKTVAQNDRLKQRDPQYDSNLQKGRLEHHDAPYSTNVQIVRLGQDDPLYSSNVQKVRLEHQDPPHSTNGQNVRLQQHYPPYTTNAQSAHLQRYDSSPGTNVQKVHLRQVDPPESTNVQNVQLKQYAPPPNATVQNVRLQQHHPPHNSNVHNIRLKQGDPVPNTNTSAPQLASINEGRESPSSGELTPSPERPSSPVSPAVGNFRNSETIIDKQRFSVGESSSGRRRSRSGDRSRSREDPALRTRHRDSGRHEDNSPAGSLRSKSGPSSEGNDYDDRNPKRERERCRDKPTSSCSSSGRSKGSNYPESVRDRIRREWEKDKDVKGSKVWDRVRDQKFRRDDKNSSRDDKNYSRDRDKDRR